MRDRPESVRFYRKRMPHWEVIDGHYFVTIRLHGVIPAAGLRRIRQLRGLVDRAVEAGQDGLAERAMVFREMEVCLHRRMAVAYLRDPRIAGMIDEAIAHRESEGVWTMFSDAIMPNHIHMFFCLGDASRSRPRRPAVAAVEQKTRSRPAVTTYSDGAEPPRSPGLETVLKSFKRWTGRRAVEILGLPSGTRFWQREWFDHWSRSAEEDEGIERYIRNNPVKAGLVARPEDWPWVR